MLFKENSKERYTILIIDDQPETRNLLVNYLEHNTEYNFYTANSGVIGYEIAKDEVPDIILLDWQMPEMDGIEVLKNLKANPLTKEIPVMMYTGIMTDSKSLQNALKLGASDFLRKPIEPIEMEARLKAAIENIKNQRIRIEQEKRILKLEKNKLEFELQSKRDTVFEYLAFITRKKEVLAEIKKQLYDVLSLDNMDEHQKSKVTAVIQYTKENLYYKTEKEDIIDILSSLSPEFLNKLSNLYPNIQKEEMEILTYLRLNIDLSKVALITQKDEQTLNKQMKNIQEKMKLSNEISLQEFVEKII